MHTPEKHLALVRRACMLIDEARYPDSDVRDRLTASVAHDNPADLAEIIVILAATAHLETANPGDIYQRLDELGYDLGDFPKWAHAHYHRYASRKATHHAPSWVRVGERLYSRYKARRQRTERKGHAA